MKRILVYVSPEAHASLFDVIVAYDSGVDAVVPYHSITAADVRDIVYNSTYTRSPADLGATAVFVGGHDIGTAAELAEAFNSVLGQLPADRRISVGMDPDGSYTTGSACVVKIKAALKKKLSGLSAIVVAGTGPVGQITAALLAKEGCDVTLTSRTMARAEAACRLLETNYGASVRPAEAKNPTEVSKLVPGSKIIVSAGPEAVMLVPKSVWSYSDADILVDLNAIPPYGIEGIDPADDCKVLYAKKLGIGAVAVGGLKMRCHRQLVRRLFEERGVFLDLGRVYKMTESM
jgi:hypothetical protein